MMAGSNTVNRCAQGPHFRRFVFPHDHQKTVMKTIPVISPLTSQFQGNAAVIAAGLDALTLPLYPGVYILFVIRCLSGLLGGYGVQWHPKNSGIIPCF